MSKRAHADSDDRPTVQKATKVIKLSERRAGKPLKLKFLEKIQATDFSQSFKVRYKGKFAYLKVFFPLHIGRWSWPSVDWVPYALEAAAYGCLAKAGFDKSPYFPELYKDVKFLDPAEFRPHLDDFLKHRVHPVTTVLRQTSAIILEYIDNMQPLSLRNINVARGQKIREAYALLHTAGVLHGEVELRHTRIVETTDRVVIIDFDQSATLHNETPTIRERLLEGMRHEKGLVDDMIDSMLKDAKLGYIDNAYSFFYEGVKVEPTMQMEKAEPENQGKRGKQAKQAKRVWDSHHTEQVAT